MPQTESPALPAKLKLGVGIRARIDIRPFDANANGQRQTSAHLSFDTLILTADYESAHIFGSAQYRFYGANFLYSRSAGYAGIPGEVNFPVYAYIGTKLTPTKKVTLWPSTGSLRRPLLGLILVRQPWLRLWYGRGL